MEVRVKLCLLLLLSQLSILGAVRNVLLSRFALRSHNVSRALRTSLTALIATGADVLGSLLAFAAIDTAPVLTGEGVALGVSWVDRPIPIVVDETLRKDIATLLIELRLLIFAFLAFFAFFALFAFFTFFTLLRGLICEDDLFFGFISLDLLTLCFRLSLARVHHIDWRDAGNINDSLHLSGEVVLNTKNSFIVDLVFIGLCTAVVSLIQKTLGRCPFVSTTILIELSSIVITFPTTTSSTLATERVHGSTAEARAATEFWTTLHRLAWSIHTGGHSHGASEVDMRLGRLSFHSIGLSRLSGRLLSSLSSRLLSSGRLGSGSRRGSDCSSDNFFNPSRSLLNGRSSLSRLRGLDHRSSINSHWAASKSWCSCGRGKDLRTRTELQGTCDIRAVSAAATTSYFLSVRASAADSSTSTRDRAAIATESSSAAQVTSESARICGSSISAGSASGNVTLANWSTSGAGNTRVWRSSRSEHTRSITASNNWASSDRAVSKGRTCNRRANRTCNR